MRTHVGRMWNVGREEGELAGGGRMGLEGKG